MAVFSPNQARQLVRQPAVWVSPTSFPAENKNNANVVASIMPMLPNRAFDMDALKLSTEQNQGPIATPFDEQSRIDLADTPYQPSTGGFGQQNLVMKLIASGVEIADNLNIDLVGDRWQPKPFQIAAITNAVRGEIERQLVVGDSTQNPLEFSGFLASDFPRQQIPTGNDPLGSLEAAIEAVNCGGGWSKVDAIFCHQQAGLEIVRRMRASGYHPPEIYVSELDRNVLAYPSAQGYIPVIYSNFFPIDKKQKTTSLIAVQLTGENGVFLATPKGTPNVRMSSIRQPQRPSHFCIAEFKCLLAAIDSGKTVELTNFPISNNCLPGLF